MQRTGKSSIAGFKAYVSFGGLLRRPGKGVIYLRQFLKRITIHEELLYKTYKISYTKQYKLNIYKNQMLYG